MAQSVGINSSGASADASSILDVSSATQGMLTPRMTKAQKDAIASPATGLLVFQTDDTPGFYYYDGTTWKFMFTGPIAWGTTGNAGINTATDFLGTTDGQDFAIKTNGTERARVKTNGKVGIGNANPTAHLTVGPTPDFTVDSTGKITKILGGMVAPHNHTVYVDAAGKGNYTTLALALAAITPTATDRYTIIVYPGDYKTTSAAPTTIKSYVTIIGSGRNTEVGPFVGAGLVDVKIRNVYFYTWHNGSTQPDITLDGDVLFESCEGYFNYTGGGAWTTYRWTGGVTSRNCLYTFSFSTCGGIYDNCRFIGTTQINNFSYNASWQFEKCFFPGNITGNQPQIIFFKDCIILGTYIFPYRWADNHYFYNCYVNDFTFGQTASIGGSCANHLYNCYINSMSPIANRAIRVYLYNSTVGTFTALVDPTITRYIIYSYNSEFINIAGTVTATYAVGTATSTAGSTTVTFAGTEIPFVGVGDKITLNIGGVEEVYPISARNSNTQITLRTPALTSFAGVAYRIDHYVIKNVESVGTEIIETFSSSASPAVTKAAALQYANLAEWRNSSSSVLSSVDSAGRFAINKTKASYSLDVAGDINITGALRLGGSAGLANYVLQSDGATTSWVDASALSGPNTWFMAGNTGITAGTNYIGTKDNVNFQVRANNTLGFTVGTNSRVRFGYSGTANATLHVAGQLHCSGSGGANSLKFGLNSDATAAGALALGNGAVASNTNAMAIGYQASASGLRSIAIGYQASATGDNAIAIGQSVANTKTESVVIGNGATADDYSVVVGVGAGGVAGIGSKVAIGYQAQATDYSIAIGRETNAFNTNTFVAGSSNYPINDVYFSEGVTEATPLSTVIYGVSGSGTDIAGAALNIAGGQSTGSGTGGSVIFQTASAGVAGSTLNNLSTRMSIQSDGKVRIGTGTATSGLHINGSYATAVVTKSAAYTLTVSDHTVLGNATTGSFILTLPAAATYPGMIYVIKKIDATANTVTIDGNGAETIDGSATVVLGAQWDFRIIQSDGTNWVVIN